MPIEDRDAHTRLYNIDNGKPIGEKQIGTFSPVDSGSLLSYPTTDEIGPDDRSWTFVGLGARDGTKYSLGNRPVSHCAATDTHLACVGDEDYEIFRYRN